MSNKAQSNSDDQISGRKIKDPVLSSTGVYYEREELLHLLKTNKHPICVITGRELTEKPEDVMKNAESDSDRQISGRKIKDPVLSSTGVYYEREELLHLLKTNKHPICVITGRELTEKPEDVMKNAESDSDRQISGRKIKDPVLSSTGVYYEREELLHLLRTNKHPICVITGRELTEKPEDVMKND